MTRRLILRPEARDDADEAASWYEGEQEGFGLQFLDEVDAILERVVEVPFQFPQVAEGVRRALLRRFPYSMYFTLGPDEVVVLAILHMHRHPGTWRRRR